MGTVTEIKKKLQTTIQNDPEFFRLASVEAIIERLENEIVALVSADIPLKEVHALLEELTGRKINYTQLSKQIGKKKPRKKNVIVVANDKGGVGKTTISTLLQLPNSILINFDRSRVIKEIYPYKEIIDFYEDIESKERVDPEDYIAGVVEKLPYSNIIIDTKGGLNEDLEAALKFATAIIVPIKIGDTSEGPSYEFMYLVKQYLDALGRNVKWGVVYNEISPKFLKKIGIRKYELNDRIQETIEGLKESVLGDSLAVVTYLKRSEAITTREYDKKDIDDLFKQKPAAYLPVKEEVDRLNRELSVLWR